MSLVGNGFTTTDARTGQRLQVNVVVNGGDDLNFTAATCGEGADTGFCFFNCGEGRGTITLSRPGYQTQILDVTFPIPTNINYAIQPTGQPGPTPSPLGHLTTSGPIFLSDGQPWRYKGVSAFALCHRFRNGENIDGFLSDYAGFNVLRVWDYTEASDGWGASAWDSIHPATWEDFIDYVNERGFHVEVTLLTSDRLERMNTAITLGHYLGLIPRLKVLIEAGNEPLTHKNINVEALRVLLQNTGKLYSSGVYEDSAKFYGAYYVNHTARNAQFPRYSHDLYEAYTGNGPDKPHDAFLVPCVGDEPGKIQDVGESAKDWLALFGGYSIMGAGGTFHSETGKTGLRPTDAEKRMAQVTLDGLNAFPADAPSGSYRRIVEPGNEPGGPTETSRTYVVGNYAVRSQQVGTSFPETGWTALDADGVLWRKG